MANRGPVAARSSAVAGPVGSGAPEAPAAHQAKSTALGGGDGATARGGMGNSKMTCILYIYNMSVCT